MTPRLRVAGSAGVLSGIGLATEFALFLASGWTPEAFGNPDSALELLRTGGAQLRAAGAVGVVNLALSILLLAGLAGKLRDSAPTRAAATLHFGVVGAAVHALVPVALWLGVPMFLGLAANEPDAARSAWGGYSVLQAAAGGAGYLFGGVAVFAAGWGLAATRVVAPFVGFIGMVAGGSAVVNVLGTGTALGGLSAVLFLPGLVLTIAFRILAGYLLWQGSPGSVRGLGPEGVQPRTGSTP